MSVKSMVIPFLLGGSIIAGAKFLAQNLKNPALAAVLAATPTGLISLYFLTSDTSATYANNYFYITMILSASILVFYVLKTHTNIDKNVALTIALVMWATLVLGRYFYLKKYGG